MKMQLFASLFSNGVIIKL